MIPYYWLPNRWVTCHWWHFDIFVACTCFEIFLLQQCPINYPHQIFWQINLIISFSDRSSHTTHFLTGIIQMTMSDEVVSWQPCHWEGDNLFESLTLLQVTGCWRRVIKYYTIGFIAVHRLNEDFGLVLCQMLKLNSVGLVTQVHGQWN